MFNSTRLKALLLVTFTTTLLLGSTLSTMAAPIKNIVLVHGAWADGSSWNKLIPLLEKKGYHVMAVHLPFTTLADAAATVKRAIALQDGPTLLVGHSYGGVVITEAGDDPKVAGLVYVAAFAPNVGQSAASLLQSVPPSPGVQSGKPDASGFISLSTEGIMKDFAQDLPAEETKIMAATQGQVSGKDEVAAPVTQAAWKQKPTYYIVSDEDRMIPPALEEKMAADMKAKTIHIRASHVVMLSHPGEVAEFIESAAGK